MEKRDTENKEAHEKEAQIKMKYHYPLRKLTNRNIPLRPNILIKMIII